jgi:hypothetical protein
MVYFVVVKVLSFTSITLSEDKPLSLIFHISILYDKNTISHSLKNGKNGGKNTGVI